MVSKISRVTSVREFLQVCGFIKALMENQAVASKRFCWSWNCYCIGGEIPKLEPHCEWRSSLNIYSNWKLLTCTIVIVFIKMATQTLALPLRIEPLNLVKTRRVSCMWTESTKTIPNLNIWNLPENHCRCLKFYKTCLRITPGDSVKIGKVYPGIEPTIVVQV